jgi:ParB-like chromosome segregation protein Spo0J
VNPLVAKTTLVALKDLKCKRLEDGYTEHPQDRKYQELEKELEKDGLLDPIVVRESTMEPIRGTQRCWFAKKNGYTHISVTYEK